MAYKSCSVLAEIGHVVGGCVDVERAPEGISRLGPVGKSDYLEWLLGDMDCKCHRASKVHTTLDRRKP